MNLMNEQRKNEKEAVKRFLDSCNFTQFCKDCRMMGITSQHEIYRLMNNYYTDRTIRKRTKKSSWEWAYCILQYDLGQKEEYEDIPFFNLLKYLKFLKKWNYKKVLIEGHSNIYWAHPYYKHADYNKSIWRENTPENRRKMEIINNFLNKI